MIPFTPQAVLLVIAWSGIAFVVLLAVVACLLAIGLRRPGLALVALVPVGAGILGLVFRLPLPDLPLLGGAVALGLAVLGIVGGNPLTAWVLRRAAKGDVDGGAHGGILVPASTPSGALSATKTREVLRGGTWIGYLERTAVVGAVLLGRWEIVAAVIAIKGLGRFSELDAAEARERFIIGTLASLIWAAVCAALIVLPATLLA